MWRLCPQRTGRAEGEGQWRVRAWKSSTGPFPWHAHRTPQKFEQGRLRMTTSDPMPPNTPPGNSPNGQSASDRNNDSDRRKRSRRARSSSDAPSDVQGEQGEQGEPDAPSAFARASDLVNAVVARIQRQPYASMAVAGGVGFVVGGALSFRAGRVVLAAAARHMSRELFRQVS